MDQHEDSKSVVDAIEPQDLAICTKSAAARPTSAVLIPITMIALDPDQPRTLIPEPELELLAQTIEQFGVLQPIQVTHARFGRYRVLIGERRLRAAEAAGLTEVPALIVPEPSPGERRVLQLVENMQRQDLDLRDRASAVAELERTGMTQKEIAERLGISTATVSKLVAVGAFLVELPAGQDRFVADVVGQEELYQIANKKPAAMAALRQYLRQVRDADPTRMAGYDYAVDPLGLVLAPSPPPPPKPPAPPPSPAARRKAMTRRERVRKKLLKCNKEDGVEIVISTVSDEAINDLLDAFVVIEQNVQPFDAAASRAQRTIMYRDDLMASCTETVDYCDEIFGGGAEDGDGGAEDRDHDDSNGAACCCYAENVGGYVLD